MRQHIEEETLRSLITSVVAFAREVAKEAAATAAEETARTMSGEVEAAKLPIPLGKAAQLAGVDKRTIKNWMAKGHLTECGGSGQPRVDLTELERFLRQGKSRSNNPAGAEREEVDSLYRRIKTK